MKTKEEIEDVGTVLEDIQKGIPCAEEYFYKTYENLQEFKEFKIMNIFLFILFIISLLFAISHKELSL